MHDEFPLAGKAEDRGPVSVRVKRAHRGVLTTPWLMDQEMALEAIRPRHDTTSASGSAGSDRLYAEIPPVPLGVPDVAAAFDSTGASSFDEL